MELPMQQQPKVQAATSAWQQLAPLRKMLAGKPGMYLAYASLWDAAGGRAGTIVTSHRDVGADNGVSPRAAQMHVEALANVGLVESSRPRR